MQVRACAGERGERAGVGPPLRVRVLVTSRLALLSCPIMTLMPSLKPPTHAQCHQRRASSRSSSQAAGATHVLFLWLNFRSPECPFLPRCLLNSLRALCAVVFRKVWYDFLRRLKPESDADWCQCIVLRAVCERRGREHGSIATTAGT